MTESNDRLNRLENQMIDIRIAVSALLETVTQHQSNFERLAIEIRNINVEIRDIKLEIRDIKVEIRDIRSDMLVMNAEIRDLRADTLQIQSEVRGLQTENRRILDILQNRNGNSEE